MRTNSSRHVLATVLGALALLAATAAQGQSPAIENVRRTHGELASWLGDADVGLAWRLFLLSSELNEQVAKGGQADRQVVQRVFDRYSSGESGLERARFAAVRESLRAWLTELAVPAPRDLPRLTLDAKSSFKPVTLVQVAQAKQRATLSVYSLDNLLQRSPYSHAQGWKSFLKWSDLQAQLQAERPDLDVVRNVIRAYHGTAEGLEMPQFMAVRASLLDFAFKAGAFGDEQLKDKYEARLEELAKLLAVYESGHKRETAREIGEIVGWLQQSGQAEELIGHIHKHYAKPNFFMRMSPPLAAAGFDRDLDEKTPGTGADGTQMNGKLTTVLLDSQGQALIRLGFAGTASTSSTTTSGPVRVQTEAQSKLTGEKDVLISAAGLKAEATKAKAETQTTLKNVEGPDQFAQIARSRFEENREQNQRSAATQAEFRLRQTLDRQVNEEVAKADQSFADSVRKPLLRRGGFPRVFEYGSTPEQLTLKVLTLGLSTLATASDPPNVTTKNDLTYRIHESALTNYSVTNLLGAITKDEDIVRFLQENTGEVPEELQVTADKERWSWRYSASPERPPLVAEFEGGLFRVTLNAEQVTRGDQNVEADMTFQAVYAVEVSPDGKLKLKRQGDLALTYGDQQRLSVRDLAFKTFLRRKFSALFREEIVQDGMTLPEPWKKIGKLPARHAAFQNDWLTVGWDLPTQNKP